MKKTIYFLIAVLFVACSGSNMNRKYEKTIRDYVLKGQSGIDFKVLEMSEQGIVTVADSIAYLTNDFRKDKEVVIKRIELAKAMTKELQTKIKLKSEYDRYAVDIQRMDARIDSLKSLLPDNLQGYGSRNTNDVLAVIIRCKYLLNISGTTVEETFDFYLSPNGNKCYQKNGI